MVHQFYELTIPQLIALEKAEFLVLCEACLAETYRECDRLEKDRASRLYAKKYHNIDLGGDESGLINW